MNTFAYLLYLAITYVITVHVGLRFYRHGRVYILALLRNNEALTDSLNRILLAGYYLLNLGYAAVMISTWKTMYSWLDVFGSVAVMTGRILFTLAIIHYLNMAMILLLARRKNHLSHHKN